MKRVRVINRTKNTVVAEEAQVAKSAWARFVGLWGRRGLAPDHGLLITPCSSIHSFFMLFTFDAIFLGRDGVVVKAVPTIRPFWLALGGQGARDVLELPKGTITRTNTAVGDQLIIEPLESP